MALIYILGGLALVLLLCMAMVGVGKIGNWLKRKRGVTELTPRQRRLQATRYRETTGRRFMKKRNRRRRS